MLFYSLFHLLHATVSKASFIKSGAGLNGLGAGSHRVAQIVQVTDELHEEVHL